MATMSEDLIASDEIEENEQTLLEGLNCPLCLNVFRSPRRLPCLHSFCQDCLQSHISSTASIKGTVKEFCCPICENVACSGEFSSDKLVHVFPLNTLMLSILLKSKVKQDLVCNACQTQDVISPAEDLCTVCDEALCSHCSKVHRSQRLSSSHAILKIVDLPSKEESVIQNNVMFNCTEHASFPVEYYCQGHNIQLCAKCFIASHKTCSDVLELINETPNISDALNQLKEQMQKIENQFKKFTYIHVSGMNKLESEVNDLTTEIRTLKKTINDVLDDLEKRVTEEANKIVCKEKKRIEQLNRGLQSHITAIRNSNLVVESASKYATQTQMFLLRKKLINRLSMTQSHTDEKYSTNEILKLQLEVNPQLKQIVEISRCEIGRLLIKRNESVAELVTEIKGLNNTTSLYTKVAFISNKHLLLVDNGNRLLYLLDSSYNIVCSYTFPGKPWDVCMVNEKVVAVTLPEQKSIHFLSLKDKSIAYIKQIQTEYDCYSIATYNHEELVVSGHREDDTFYWTIITLEGKKKSYHEFDGDDSCQTYITLNTFKSRLYISVSEDDSLLCFGLDGMIHFSFTHDNLKGPQGVTVDRDDNVYVVGSQSHNIFKLSPDGFIIQIIVNAVENKPFGICFDQTGDKFALTHARGIALSLYTLADRDW